MILATERKRVALPQAGERFITEAGLETELVFRDGIDLPHFSTAGLLDSPQGHSRLKAYFRDFVELARTQQCGVIFETATWRLNSDWAIKQGFDKAERRRLNFAAVHLLQDLREDVSLDSGRFVISGNLGPRFDGYTADQLMHHGESADYHAEQIEMLRDAGADCICAMTITNANEGVGIATAARDAGMPAVISFTLETTGRLPSGETLSEAITAVDEATDQSVAYFGINCAHPTHFKSIFEPAADWVERIGSIRANSSRKSHQELDESVTLDAGDSEDLAKRYRELRAVLPGLRVFGGCCGTDRTHVESICRACFSQ